LAAFQANWGKPRGLGLLEKLTMWLSANRLPAKHRLLSGLSLAAALGLSGCQMDIGGQTLPSPYWQTDDVQYFPAGPEFKLSREAAAMKAFKQDQTRAGPPAPPPAAAPPEAAPAPGDVAP
jgi:hypothetical protein